MNIPLLLISATLIVLASFAGKFATLFKGEEFLSRNMGLFGSFSAGVFAIIVFGNIKESGEHLGVTLALLLGLFGFLAITTAEKFLPEAHHHHGKEDGHTHDKKSSWKIQIADALHNTVDGIALAATFATSSLLGIKMTISVFAHEFVQETGEYFALRATGLNKQEALWQNFLVALTIFIGVAVGLVATARFDWLEPWILALTAGAYTSVIVNDLLPSDITKKDIPLVKYLLCFLCGILLMVIIQQLFPHLH